MSLASFFLNLQEKDLLNLFILTINSLQRFSESQMSAFSREDVAILNRFLSLAEQIFLWEFMSGNHILFTVDCRD